MVHLLFLPTIQASNNLLSRLWSNYSNTSPWPYNSQITPFYRGRKQGEGKHKPLSHSKSISRLLSEHRKTLLDPGGQWVLHETLRVSFSSLCGHIWPWQNVKCFLSGSPDQNHNLLSTTTNLLHTNHVLGAVLAASCLLSQIHSFTHLGSTSHL